MAAQNHTAAASGAGFTLETLPFDNQSLQQLPLDKEVRNYTRSPVKDACFSLVEPAPLERPQLCAVSKSALDLLGLAWPSEAERPEFVEYFAGNRKLPGSQTAAHCYCGHQFGYFSGQLGDGAAMYLGEVVTPPANPEAPGKDGSDEAKEETAGKQGQRWELQLKGSGPTPYSRQADGRKVLRSSIREFLCSEAMWGLGIPTTRAGTLVTSDTWVDRDMFYTGQVEQERASVISRIAPCFIRFGSFEVVKGTDPVTGRSGSSPGNVELLERLLHFVIRQHYPELWTEDKEKREDMYLDFFLEVVRRTAQLVADWQTVGFCHGVLNTDNMSILGLTIDYGPFGFMGHFDPDFVCNTSDDGGRYSYANQPEMCRWNCEKLAEVLRPLLPLNLSMPLLDEVFEQAYDTRYWGRMRLKLGLLSGPELDRISHQYESGEIAEPEAGGATPGSSADSILRSHSEHYRRFHWDHQGHQHLADSLEPASAADQKVVQDLLEVMATTAADFTNTFRALSLIDTSKSGDEGEDAAGAQQSFLDYIVGQCANGEQLKQTVVRETALDRQRLEALARLEPQKLMALGCPPALPARELAKLNKLDAIEQQSEEARRAANRQLWAIWVRGYVARLRELQANGAERAQAHRVAVMQRWNPSAVLRNWIAHFAIKQAESRPAGKSRKPEKTKCPHGCDHHGPGEGRNEPQEWEDPSVADYSEIHRVLSLVSEPYRDQGEGPAAVRSPEPPFPHSEVAPQPRQLLVSAADGPQGEEVGQLESGCRIIRNTVIHPQYDSVSPEWMQDTVLAVSCSS